MVFVLQDEIPHIANILIHDLSIKRSIQDYADKDGNPEVLPENPNV